MLHPVYTCIAIDDEVHAIEGLKRYVESVPGLDLVQTFTDPLIALRTLLVSARVDLVLLDIDMPGLNGIELSKAIRTKTDKLIFTTGHTEYGYEAFRAEADDYLLKPYSLAEFVAAINKLFPGNGARNGAERGGSFFVKSKTDQHKLIHIRFSDVVLVESKLNYVLIHTTSRNVLTYMTLREIGAILGQHPGFMQFQRSYIVAQAHIDYIDGNTIRMLNGVVITVGEYYKKAFAAFLDRHVLKTGKRN
ncbi:DNA-binding response regulator [Pedobacter yulinensis]|uniref:DNA-binding response regulator n=1 Tax=Pedobacter yulinensis TaxID=2126353 RepID=A0A2T3HNV9_9SPHI|nr:LytTR family DNA-binding domain-containing protein [Pedobacter yulinensis]PST84134.1 DNA-binding response regulator [Pedobacter yulinensis]